MKIFGKKEKQLLFCPGPVNLATNVKKAVLDGDICHREKEFESIISSINTKLLQVFEIKNPEKYIALCITGSGTAGNEAVISSAGYKKKILVLINGEFGQRLYDIAKLHYPKSTSKMEFSSGSAIDIEKVTKYLSSHKIDLVIMVHHETSTGMLNPVEQIGKLAKKYHSQLMVDTVSSATAEKVDIEKWNITFCTTTSGKAIASIPGIGLVIGKRADFEKFSTHAQKITYLNLYKFYTFAIEHNQTPNTPSVHLFFALETALSNILKEGIAKRRKRIKKLAEYLRWEMKALGLTLFLEKEDASHVLTTVNLPSYITFKKLQEELRKKRIIVYNGKGPLKDKVFQVGHIGELSMKDAKYFIKQLKKVLHAYNPAKHTFSVTAFFSGLFGIHHPAQTV